MADILHRIVIAAPPERVFDAITTAEGLRSWWTKDSTAEPKAGSVAVFKFNGGKVVFRMRIDALDPGRKVEWTCLGDWPEWGDTTLSWDLEPTDDGGTTLRFAHRGWKTTEKEYAACNSTWGHLMFVLKDYVEGKPVEPQFLG